MNMNLLSFMYMLRNLYRMGACETNAITGKCKNQIALEMLTDCSPAQLKWAYDQVDNMLNGFTKHEARYQSDRNYYNQLVVTAIQNVINESEKFVEALYPEDLSLAIQMRTLKDMANAEDHINSLR